MLFTLLFPSVANAQVKRYRLNNNDYQILLAVVQQEGGQDYESARWVTSTIINRVENPRFDNTIMEVVTASGQFEAYGAGHYQKHLGHINKDVKRGVDDILTNESIHPYLYFWSTWYAQQMGRAGVEMGGNVYFKDF